MIEDTVAIDQSINGLIAGGQGAAGGRAGRGREYRR